MRAPVLTLDGLRSRFARRPNSLLDLADDIHARCAVLGGACIAAAFYAAARDLLARHPDPSALPLWGVPYALDAGIDVVGLTTSIGAPAFDLQPDFDAVVVERLRAAGALLVGKLPVDPFGRDAPVAHALAAIAAGLAAFVLIGDRADAVPVDCGLAVVKPTLAGVSIEGVSAMAPDVDGIAILTSDVAGGAVVRRALESVDGLVRPACPPGRLGLLGGETSEAAQAIIERLGLETVATDVTPFAEIAALARDDVWLAPRLDDMATAFAEQPELVPTRLRRRLSEALALPACDLARAQRRLLALRRQVEAAFSDFDLLFVAPEFGSTGFVNACGLAAIGLPDGGALVGAGGTDDRLGAIAATLTALNKPRSTRPIDIPASSPLAHR
ncbi:amidase family protein [Pleomorphomonas sp. NRK KF1]|uniref:amidase family protein n=1 Tax=Pleomorphomonas sp. NRK KF1 TaxID=2943000 RepID=UPI002043CC8F|nr:amidase family protein [Pleomorphomonas sp. NRK KF1]MCM5552801.1 amidase family protein [Pleomorphomonas sp. NRK KF1]